MKIIIIIIIIIITIIVIITVIEKQKKNAFIEADNVPDFSQVNVTNEFYFSKLCCGSGLDLLGMVNYAARGPHRTTWIVYGVLEVNTLFSYFTIGAKRWGKCTVFIKTKN